MKPCAFKHLNDFLCTEPYLFKEWLEIELVSRVKTPPSEFENANNVLQCVNTSGGGASV